MKYVILIVLLFITIFPYTLSIVVDPVEGVATIDDGVVSYTHPNLVIGSFVYDSFFMELKQIWIKVGNDGKVFAVARAAKFPALFRDEFLSFCEKSELKIRKVKNNDTL